MDIKHSAQAFLKQTLNTLHESDGVALDRPLTGRDTDRLSGQVMGVLSLLPGYPAEMLALFAQEQADAISTSRRLQGIERQVRQTLHWSEHQETAVEVEPIDDSEPQTKPPAVIEPIEVEALSALVDLSVLVADETMRTRIEKRWDEAQRCQLAGVHSAAVIMLSGVLEGVLISFFKAHLDIVRPVLQQMHDVNKARNKKSYLPNPQSDVTSWPLYLILDIAKRAELIKPEREQFSQSLRDIRNIVHLSKEPFNDAVDETTYQVAKQVVLGVMNDLIEYKKK